MKVKIQVCKMLMLNKKSWMILKHLKHFLKEKENKVVVVNGLDVTINQNVQEIKPKFVLAIYQQVLILLKLKYDILTKNMYYYVLFKQILHVRNIPPFTR